MLSTYCAATVFAPFGTGTLRATTLLSCGFPGRVTGSFTSAVFPKYAIRKAIPPATSTSAATYGRALVMRLPSVC